MSDTPQQEQPQLVSAIVRLLFTLTDERITSLTQELAHYQSPQYAADVSTPNTIASIRKDLNTLMTLRDLAEKEVTGAVPGDADKMARDITKYFQAYDPDVFPIKFTMQSAKPTRLLIETNAPMKHATGEWLDETFPGMVTLDKTPLPPEGEPT